MNKKQNVVEGSNPKSSVKSNKTDSDFNIEHG